MQKRPYNVTDEEFFGEPKYHVSIEEECDCCLHDGIKHIVYLFDSFEECIEYIRANISEYVAQDLNRQRTQFVNGTIVVSSGTLEELAEKYEAENNSLKKLSNNIWKMFDKYSSFFYGFKDLDFRNIVETGDYVVFECFVNVGGKKQICYVGFDDGKCRFSSSKIEYTILSNKYKIETEILYSGLSEKMAYICAKCLVLNYSDKGEILIEQTAESYREHNAKIKRESKRGIFLDDFAKKYLPEIIDIQYSFDSPEESELSDIFFLKGGDPDIYQWITAHHGKIYKKSGKGNKCIIAEKNISYTEFYYYKENGKKIYLADDVKTLLGTVKIDYGHKSTSKISIPKYDSTLRSLIRNDMPRFENLMANIDAYRRGDSSDGETISHNKSVRQMEAEFIDSLADSSSLKFWKRIVILMHHLRIYKENDEVKKMNEHYSSIAGTYEDYGLFDEEIALLTGTTGFEKKLINAIKLRDADRANS